MTMSCARRGSPDLVIKRGWRELCLGRWVFWNDGLGARPQVRVYQGY